MILPGTPTRLRHGGRAALPVLPGAEATSSIDDQRSVAPVRRLAYEAADAGLLSPELAAGIRRVKGAKRLGKRLGNWLTVEQGRKLLQAVPQDTARGKRDRAILALLIGCGFRRAELVG